MKQFSEEQITCARYQKIMALTEMLGPDGRICVDYYWRRFQTMRHPKYVLRPLTKRMRPEWVFSIHERCSPIL